MSIIYGQLDWVESESGKSETSVYSISYHNHWDCSTFPWRTWGRSYNTVVVCWRSFSHIPTSDARKPPLKFLLFWFIPVRVALLAIGVIDKCQSCHHLWGSLISAVIGRSGASANFSQIIPQVFEGRGNSTRLLMKSLAESVIMHKLTSFTWSWIWLISKIVEWSLHVSAWHAVYVVTLWKAVDLTLEPSRLNLQERLKSHASPLRHFLHCCVLGQDPWHQTLDLHI